MTYVFFFYLLMVALFMLFLLSNLSMGARPKSERVSPTSCILLGFFAIYIALDVLFDAAFVYIVWGAVIPNNMVENPGNGFFLHSKLEKHPDCFYNDFSLYVYYLGTFNGIGL